MSTSPPSQLGLLLRLAHRRAASALAQELGANSFDGKDVGVLMLLARGGGQTQRELADQLGTDRTSMVRSLDRLEADQLVTRVGDPADRRLHRISLTAKGEESTQALRQTLDHVAHKLTGHMSSQESEELVRLLRRFNEAP